MTNKQYPTPYVAVVGAGLAGLTIAHHLAQDGWQVDVYDAHIQNDPASVHAGHLAAGMMPIVSADINLTSELSLQGGQVAQAFWASLSDAHVLPIGIRCGAIQVQRASGRQADLQRVLEKLAMHPQAQQWMPDWVCGIDAQRASELSGQSLNQAGAYFANAWCIWPERLLTALAHHDNIRTLSEKVNVLTKNNGFWVINGDRSSRARPYSVVVVANSVDSKRLLLASNLISHQHKLDALYGLAGEVTYLPESILESNPRCILAGDAYILPAVNGLCAVGGTYARDATVAQKQPGGAWINIKRAADLLNQPDLLERVDVGSLQGWAGWRAVMPNRLPVIGPIAPHRDLWVATGFASRGLTWSVLAAQQVATGLSGQPNPLPDRLVRAISPL